MKGNGRKTVVSAFRLCRMIFLPLALFTVLAFLFGGSAAGSGVIERISNGPEGVSLSNSGSPALSSNGRFTAFESDANNLVAGDTNGGDIFLRDSDGGLITRISTTSSGGQANSSSSMPTISGDGRYVAFLSGATNLVSGDSNNTTDVFLKDTSTNATTRISTDSAGSQANGTNFSPSISADGRYVVFSSNASNLVVGDTNAARDVFVKDTQSGTTTRVSTDSGGGQANGASDYASISADGRHVAFYSTASNLVSGDTNGVGDFFEKDLDSGLTIRVSTSSSGTQSNSDPAEPYSNIYSPALSSDGRLVLFASFASNLVSSDTNGFSDIFLKDTMTGAISRVSTDAAGGQASGRSTFVSLSSDGHFAAFTSEANNLVPGDTNSRDLFVKDVQTGAIILASTSSDGQPANSFVEGWQLGTQFLSGDGRYAGFWTRASNLVPGDINGWDDVFVKDTQTGVTSMISKPPGNNANGGSLDPSISTDGRYIAYDSTASNLIGADSNAASDIFVYDRDTGTTSRASVGTTGTQVPANSYKPSISQDGRYVAFYAADNAVLSSGDTNGMFDIFVKDRQTGSVEILSRALGGAAGDHNSMNPSVSADGRYVAFESDSTNLVANDTNTHADVFVYDRQTDTISRQSTSSSGGQANFGASSASISADGSHVAFMSFANNLVSGDTNGMFDIFVKDIASGNITRVSTSSTGVQGNANSSNVSISSDGRYVSFISDATNLVPGDTNGQADTFRKDVLTGATTMVSTDSAGNQANGQSVTTSISDDGRYVAFSSKATNLGGPDSKGASQYYVKDALTGQTTMVSTNASGDAGSGSTYTYGGKISGDGRYVAFASDATNLVPWDINNSIDIFVAGGPACGGAKPQLSLTMARVYWGSFVEYQSRILSVDFQVDNAGFERAGNVTITGSPSSGGVTVSSSMPFMIGDLAAGNSAAVTLKYSVPPEVTFFRTGPAATASDVCGSSYSYP